MRARIHDLIRQANVAGRIFVTRNRHAEQFPPANHLVLLAETNPVLQLGILVHAFHLDTQAGLFSHCLRGNVELGAVTDKQAVASRIHPNVYARQERFFTCPRCGTVFRHGRHVANTRRKLGLTPPALPAVGDLTAP